jgi:hypothetical protein
MNTNATITTNNNNNDDDTNDNNINNNFNTTKINHNRNNIDYENDNDDENDADDLSNCTANRNGNHNHNCNHKNINQKPNDDTCKISDDCPASKSLKGLHRMKVPPGQYDPTTSTITGTRQQQATRLEWFRVTGHGSEANKGVRPVGGKGWTHASTNSSVEAVSILNGQPKIHGPNTTIATKASPEGTCTNTYGRSKPMAVFETVCTRPVAQRLRSRATFSNLARPCWSR